MAIGHRPLRIRYERATLNAIVQSVGSPADIPVRDVIAQGLLPGPRILTSVEGFLRIARSFLPFEFRVFGGFLDEPVGNR
jgi:hypothetical protein